MIDVGRVNLVVGRHRIQQPDVVLCAVVFDIGEMRVVGGVVELHLRVGIVCGDYRFLEGKTVYVVAVPVIGVRAQRDDRLRRIEKLHPLVDDLLEPGLARDAPRRPRRRVLVIGHEHGVIDGLREGPPWPGVVGNRRGDHHDPAMRLERAAQVAQEHAVIAVGIVGQGFQIHHHAVEFVLREIIDELPDQRCIALGIGQKRGHALAVPHAECRVLHHGQDRDAFLIAPDEIVDPLVEAVLERQVRSLKADPGGHHPIELGQRHAQGIESRCLPVGEEGHGKRAAALRQQGGGGCFAMLVLPGDPPGALPFGLLDARRFGQLLGGFQKTRRDGFLFQLGGVDGGDMARQVEDGLARHGDKACHECAAQNHAGDDRDPADERDACRAFSGGVEKDGLFCHDVPNRLRRMTDFYFTSILI